MPELSNPDVEGLPVRDRDRPGRWLRLCPENHDLPHCGDAAPPPQRVKWRLICIRALFCAALIVFAGAAPAQVIIIPGKSEPPPPPPPTSPRPIPPPFELLPDGRIGVEIFGQKIGLPVTATDPDQNLDLIEFYPLRARPFGERSTTFTLRRALMEPEKVKLAFEQEPSWISVRIIGWPKGAKTVLGGFDRDLLPVPGPADPLSFTVGRNPESKPPKRGTLPDWWPHGKDVPDGDGYLVRPGVIPPTRKEPDVTAYLLPATQRLWPTDVDLGVVCGWGGIRTRECRQVQTSPDGRITLGWRWDEDKFPKPRWKELDLRLHQVANYLLLNKPSGELE